MRVGDRVLVRRSGGAHDPNSFAGQFGRVTQDVPFLMVLLEGERKPLRFGERELVRVETPQHIGGAE